MRLKLNKLGALTAAISSLPQTAEPFMNRNPRRPDSPAPFQEPRVVFSGRQPSKASGDSRQEPAGLSSTNLGGKNTGADDNIEEYNDFGEQWIGEAPDSTLETPGNLLGNFKKADEEYDADTLKLFGYKKMIDDGVKQLEQDNWEAVGYPAGLNELGSACVELLKLLCKNSLATQRAPDFAKQENSTLARLHRLFMSSGVEEGRRLWLQKIDEAFSHGEAITPGSVPGMMLSNLGEHIASVIKQNVAGANAEESVTGAAMHSPLVSILDHYQRMHERQAGVETISGNHAEATALLKKCLSVVRAQWSLDPALAAGKLITLHFDLFKSQLLAGDEEAVTTLEDNYLYMLQYAKDYASRFPPDFPQALFVANLEDAYSQFLDEYENEAFNPSLEHPIARLFTNANERGVFNDTKLD